MLGWMAWTWPVTAFFAAIAVGLIVLTILAVARPEAPRHGVLRFPTTRGDRFFISLLSAAYIYILWMRFGGGSLIYPTIGSIVLAVAIFIYV